MWLLRTWSRRLTENRNFNITRIIPLLLTIEVVDRSFALFADGFGRSRSGQFSGSFLALELRDVDVNRGQGRIDAGLILEEYLIKKVTQINTSFTVEQLSFDLPHIFGIFQSSEYSLCSS